MNTVARRPLHGVCEQVVEPIQLTLVADDPKEVYPWAFAGHAELGVRMLPTKTCLMADERYIGLRTKSDLQRATDDMT